MDLHLGDQLALVTASTGGIGQAIAATLAREGARVIVNGRSPEGVESAIAEIRARVPGMRENRPTSLIERLLEPKEIADFVAYVSSPLANGAGLRVDGGLVRSVF